MSKSGTFLFERSAFIPEILKFLLKNRCRHHWFKALEGLFRDNETNNTNENNRVKNPNWSEADQLAIYKDDRGVEPDTYPEQHQLVARA